MSVCFAFIARIVSYRKKFTKNNSVFFAAGKRIMLLICGIVFMLTAGIIDLFNPPKGSTRLYDLSVSVV